MFFILLVRQTVILQIHERDSGNPAPLLLGKLSSIFVSEIINKSTSPLTFRMRASNLFLIEMMFKCATTNLFKLISQINFKWLMSLPLDL